MPVSIKDIPRLSLSDIGEQANSRLADNFRQASNVQQPPPHPDQARESAFFPKQARPTRRGQQPAVGFFRHAPGEVKVIAFGEDHIRNRATLSPNLSATVFPPRERDLKGEWKEGPGGEEWRTPPSYENLAEYRNTHIFDATQTPPHQHQIMQEFGGRLAQLQANLNQLQADQNSGRLTDDELASRHDKFNSEADTLYIDVENARRGTSPSSVDQGVRKFGENTINFYGYTIIMNDIGVQTERAAAVRPVRVSDTQLARSRARIEIVAFLEDESGNSILDQIARLMQGTITNPTAVRNQVLNYAKAHDIKDQPTIDELQELGRQVASGEPPPGAELSDLRRARASVSIGHNDREHVLAANNVDHPEDIALICGQRIRDADLDRFGDELVGRARNSQDVYRAADVKGYTNPLDRFRLNEIVSIKSAESGYHSDREAIRDFKIHRRSVMTDIETAADVGVH